MSAPVVSEAVVGAAVEMKPVVVKVQVEGPHVRLLAWAQESVVQESPQLAGIVTVQPKPSLTTSSAALPQVKAVKGFALSQQSLQLLGSERVQPEPTSMSEGHCPNAPEEEEGRKRSNRDKSNP